MTSKTKLHSAASILAAADDIAVKQGALVAFIRDNIDTDKGCALIGEACNMAYDRGEQRQKGKGSAEQAINSIQTALGSLDGMRLKGTGGYESDPDGQRLTAKRKGGSYAVTFRASREPTKPDYLRKAADQAIAANLNEEQFLAAARTAYRNAVEAATKEAA